MKSYRLAFIFLFLVSCAHQNNYVAETRQPNAAEEKISPIDFNQERGSPAEYDAGPPKNSKWPDIFAETPNYRSYGKAIYQSAAEKAKMKADNDEKFRWIVGPMWYRGRLTPNSVKVFVIGQEGAQDENVSNRTFTGSTGTKMQNFINYFGINQSYLFMNTFIYTITGQYGERPTPCNGKQSTKDFPCDNEEEAKAKLVRSNALFWLAQNENSAIVKHRHRMFDYMLEQNKDTLRLIIGVGSAGKDTLATWIRSHGGKCTAQQLGQSFCDASMIAAGAKAIGVMHPGAASARNGGSGAAGDLKVQFANRASVVAKWIEEDKNWMKPDPEMKPDFSKDYQYKDAGIPYRDFAFGTNWRMGNDGTATNRRGADGIQIYSANGCYNNAVRLPNGRCDNAVKPKVMTLKYDEPADLQSEIKMTDYDVPYESPKSIAGRDLYDVGPGNFAPILMGYKAGGWPDFNALGVTQHKSFGYGAIYRGNLKNPEVVILADQESQDDFFSTRALTGTGGQMLQKYLSTLGVHENYVIIRTLPVDTLDLSPEKSQEIALNPDVVKVRNSILKAILEQGKTEVILTIGPAAEAALAKSKEAKDIKTFNLKSPFEDKNNSQWQKEASAIATALNHKVETEYEGELMAVPREDLPAHTRFWMGTSGSRAYRAYTMNGKNKVWNGDYYQFQAPTWVNTKNYPANVKEIMNPKKEDPNNYIESLNVFKSMDAQ